MQILEKEVIEGEDKFPNVQIRILVDIKNREEFKEWLTEFENKTSSSYAIRNTDIEEGKKLLFKQRLQCHHSTGCKRVYNPLVKGKTRNTNCPAKMTVKIYNVEKKYRGKDIEKFALLTELPCEIILVLTHNHATGTVDNLRLRKVSNAVKEQLMEHFCNGHSPKTAQDMIKVSIQLNSEDSQTALVDRSQCPNYSFCHNLYTKVFKQKYESISIEAKDNRFLETQIDKYNAEQKTQCAKILFKGEDREDYVICATTPIMKRVHTHIEGASQIVTIDSSGILDKKGRKLYLLLTDTECGVLPLALIISTEKVDDLTMGFELLKELLGDIKFGGHVDGPQIFMTDESSAEQNAIANVWPKAKCLLSPFHVLQSFSKWLSKHKNCIPKEDQPTFFSDFQNILYAKTIKEMTENYEAALKNAQRFGNLVDYLSNYWWKIRLTWAVAYWDNSLIKNSRTSNSLQYSMRQLKDDLIGRLKSFNIVQVLDFMLTQYEKYNERNLLDAANNRLDREAFCKWSQTSSREFLTTRMRKLSDSMVLVPGFSQENLINLVNMEVLTCSCQDGATGYVCKHIDLANIMYGSESQRTKINDPKLRQIFFFIATGKKGLVVKLIPLNRKSNEIQSDISIDHVEYPSNEQVEAIDSLTQDIEMTSSNEDCINQFNEIFTKISNIFYDFLKESPEEVLSSTQIMFEHMKQIKNPGDFANAVSTFGLEK